MKTVSVARKMYVKGKKVCGESWYQKVPCGHCGFCLEAKRSQWMFRIWHEIRMQEYPGWFVTLTYDEKYVKRTASGLSLRFRDVQLFIKKLRKQKHYVKYICVGEYGSKTARPHYHLLMWTDCPPVDFSRYWSTKKGAALGRIQVGNVSMQAAMYTLKYIIQPKVKGNDGRERTRAQFSKGIGLGYLTVAMCEYHTANYDAPRFSGRADGREVALPRYYRTKIFDRYQLKREGERVKWESIRDFRKELRKVVRQGRKNVSAYLHSLRVVQAERIIEKSKVNLKL